RGRVGLGRRTWRTKPLPKSRSASFAWRTIHEGHFEGLKQQRVLRRWVRVCFSRPDERTRERRPAAHSGTERAQEERRVGLRDILLGFSRKVLQPTGRLQRRTGKNQGRDAGCG